MASLITLLIPVVGLVALSSLNSYALSADTGDVAAAPSGEVVRSITDALLQRKKRISFVVRIPALVRSTRSKRDVPTRQ